MRYERVDSLSGLRAIEAAWWSLYRSTPHSSIFTSPGWVMSWLESFAADAPLYCVLAYAGSQLRAVFPLVPTASRWRRLPLTILTACTNAHSVRSAVLCAPQDVAVAYPGALRLLESARGWDMLLLDGCDLPPVTDSCAMCACNTHAAPVPPLPRELLPERWSHSSLTVEGSYASYHGSRSRDLRRNLRRTESDLAGMGRLEFEVIQDDADRLFSIWSEVDNASWKAESGETVNSNERTGSFYRNILRTFQQRGQLFSTVLSLDGAPVAVLACAIDKGTLHTIKIASLASLSNARLSLGAVIMARTLEAAWTLPGLRRVDFVSLQAFTRRWTDEVTTYERRVSVASTWRGRTAALLDHTVRQMPKRRTGTTNLAR